MFKKKESSTNMFINGLTLMLAGIIFVCIVAKDIFYSFQEPVDLYDLSLDEIKKGEVLEVDIYAALGPFMYEETSNKAYGIKISSQISGYYYIIPVGDEEYMAVQVEGYDEDEMNAICDNTYSYIVGESASLGADTFYAIGGIRNMREQELQYMVEWFQETEYFGTKDENVIKTYIHPVMLEPFNGDSSKIFAGFGLFMSFVGIIMMVIYKVKQGRIEKKNREYYSEYMQNNGYPPYNVYAPNNSIPNNVYTPGSNLQMGSHLSQDPNLDLYNPTYDDK